MADVFISYKREDRRWAEKIDALLRKAGFSTWWDTSIVAGEQFSEAIDRELQKSRCVVVVWSEAARASRWVQAEAIHGFDRGVLVAGRSDNVKLQYPFDSVQTVDIRTNLNGLIDGVRQKLSQSGTSKKAEARLLPSTVWQDDVPGLRGSDVPEMVTLPRGEYLMGTAAGERYDSEDAAIIAKERPQHKVRIGYSLAVGRFPITVEQYTAFVRDSKHDIGDQAYIVSDKGTLRLSKGHNYLYPGMKQTARHPVTCVNWFDAKAYVAWLNKRVGLAGRPDAYRLPTESEWEYACRANSATRFNVGERIEPRHANFNKAGNDMLLGNIKFAMGVMEVKGTSSIDSYEPNAFGLCDMHGNVWEWCEDAASTNYNGAPTDGSASQIKSGERIIRGGSWVNWPMDLRSANRVSNDPSDRQCLIGFRLARSLSR